MRPLVVIDMQSGFDLSDYPEVISGCLDEIRRAMDEHRPIVIVELDGFGKTVPAIRRLIEGYALLTTCRKKGADGSEKVAHALRKHAHSIIDLCGVFCIECIRETAIGLAGRGSQVVLRRNAIDADELDEMVEFLSETGIELLVE